MTLQFLSKYAVIGIEWKSDAENWIVNVVIFVQFVRRMDTEYFNVHQIRNDFNDGSHTTIGTAISVFNDQTVSSMALPQTTLSPDKSALSAAQTSPDSSAFVFFKSEGSLPQTSCIPDIATQTPLCMALPAQVDPCF